MSLLSSFEIVLRAGNYTGSGNWLDESGNGHNATPVGSPTFNGDHFSLDGSTQWFTVADDPGLDFAADESFTVIVVAATDDLAPTGSKSLYGKVTGGVGYWGRQFNGEAWFVGYIDDGTNNPFDVKTSAFAATGQRTVLAFVRDVASDDLEVFSDGSGSGSPTTDSTTATLANGASLFIGAQATSTEAFPGDIYAFGISRSALTDTQVLQAGYELIHPGTLLTLGI